MTDPRSKAALLKKMGLGDEANKDTLPHPTPSGWPPYPLGPLCGPGFIPPFPYESAAPHAWLIPMWRERHGPESQWAGLQYEPPDEAEEPH